MFFVEVLLKVIDIFTYIFFPSVAKRVMENFMSRVEIYVCGYVDGPLPCCHSFLTGIVLANVGASGILLVYYKLLVRHIFVANFVLRDEIEK
jgi:hypothetical protein